MLKHRLLIDERITAADLMGGQSSQWIKLGDVWAAAKNSTLRDVLNHGEVKRTQVMIFDIRQKQRFTLDMRNCINYRITDARGQQYRIINFEQSDFGLDFYRLVCELWGNTAT